MTSEHVKIWANDSQWIGLVVKPFTYRVNFSPTFFPRFSVGDIRGIDQQRWRSWVQSRFDEGEGQLLWSSSSATNRYAQGHLVEVGKPLIRSMDYGMGMPGNTPVNLGPAPYREDSVVGDISPTALPQMNTQGTKQVHFNTTLPVVATAVYGPATYFTDKYPTFIVEWSGRPSLWHWKTAWWYTDVADSYAWDNGSEEGYASKFTGKWEMLWQHSAPLTGAAYISDVVSFLPPTPCSNHHQAALQVAFGGNPSLGLMVLGSTHTLGLTGSTALWPAYSTAATHLTVYDDKLWRANEGVLSYLIPDIVSTSFTRWEGVSVGDNKSPILKIREFNGRLYIGKENALWTFDAGRVYRVEDFSSYTDKNNFSHMTVHRGYMYFNIKHMLFRLSTAGTIEQVQTYPQGGTIVDAVSVGDKLYYLARQPGIHPTTDVWVFDPETGGNFRSFSTSNIGKPNWKSPRSLGTAYGALYVTPMTDTTASAVNMPLEALDPVTPYVQAQFPNFAAESWFATSMLDFGLPTLTKTFKRITVDYELASQASDYIDVYYITALKSNKSIKRSFEIAPTKHSFPITNLDDNLIDGSLATGRTFNLVGTGAYMWVTGIASTPGATRNGTTNRLDIAGLRWIGQYASTDLPNKLAMLQTPEFRLKTYNYAVGLWVTVSDFDDFKVSYQPGDGPNTNYIIIDYVFPAEQPRWLYNLNTADICENSITDSRGLQVWLGLESAGTYPAEDKFTALEALVTKTSQPTPTENQDWTYLGRIGGYADPATAASDLTRASLDFPVGLIAQQMMLKFVFHASRISRPALRRYEIEWMPAPGQLKTYNFTIPVAENIEMPNLQIVANATSVVATVFSMAGAGRPYVCQMPWPGSHTISAIVSIVSPGGVVPSLRDDNMDNSHAEIPIQLDAL